MARLMESYLGCFLANGTAYDHTIDLNTDATYIRRQEDVASDDYTFQVDSNAHVFDSEGERIGAFRLYSYGWAYFADDRDFGEGGIETDTQDLLKAERQVFKLLLEKA